MKKAQVFDASMVFVVIAAMGGILFVSGEIEERTTLWEVIGQRGFELQQAYSQADLFVTTIASSARWSATKTIQELGKNGGHVKSPCGTLQGYSLWNKPEDSKACFPNAYENFYSLLKRELGEYNRLYPGFGGVTYEFLLENGSLLGVAANPLLVRIMTPKERFVEYRLWGASVGASPNVLEYDPRVAGVYVFRPSFETSIPYDLGVYEWLVRAAEEIIQECTPPDQVLCVRTKLENAEKLSEEDWAVNFRIKNNIVFADIIQTSRESVYFGGAPSIRFAFYLSQPKTI